MENPIKQSHEKLGHHFKKHSPRSLQHRLSMLQRLYDSIQTHERKITHALKSDLGKSATEAYTTEIGFSLKEISEAQKCLPKWMRAIKVSTPWYVWPSKSQIYHRPLGRVLLIGPWNYPFQLLISPLVGAIAGGNVGILKTSEFAPQTAEVIDSVIRTAFPNGEWETYTGDSKTSTELLKLEWDHIFFTGSTRVGRIVMQSAADHLTPVTLELGGKSPCLITESANIESAASRVVWGKFTNAGQTCVAPDYVLIHESRKEAFVKACIDKIRQFYGTDPKQSPDYGRIVSQTHMERLKSLAEPCKVIHGGDFDMVEKYVGPTLLEPADSSSAIMNEEIFGPLLPILSFRTDEEAIEIMANHPNPLAFYLFSEKRAEQEFYLSKISFGGGCINNTLIHLANSHLPFGGIRQSGIGKYHGKYSFEVFTHKQSIVHSKSGFDFSIKFPPYKDRLKWFKKVLS